MGIICEPHFAQDNQEFKFKHVPFMVHGPIFFLVTGFTCDPATIYEVFFSNPRGSRKLSDRVCPPQMVVVKGGLVREMGPRKFQGNLGWLVKYYSIWPDEPCIVRKKQGPYLVAVGF